jgi:hypothetical protein
MQWGALDPDLQQHAGVDSGFQMLRLPMRTDEEPFEAVTIDGIVWVIQFTVSEPAWWPRLFFGRRIPWLENVIPKRIADTRISPPKVMVMQPMPDDSEAAARLATALAAQVRRWHCEPRAKPSPCTWWYPDKPSSAA